MKPSIIVADNPLIANFLVLLWTIFISILHLNRYKNLLLEFVISQNLLYEQKVFIEFLTLSDYNTFFSFAEVIGNDAINIYPGADTVLRGTPVDGMIT